MPTIKFGGSGEVRDNSGEVRDNSGEVRDNSGEVRGLQLMSLEGVDSVNNQHYMPFLLFF